MALGITGLATGVRAFYDVNGELRTPAGRGRYLLRVPAGHDADRACPLVVVVHGFMQSPAHQCEMSRWDELAAAEGFLTVYPLGSGVPPHWAAPGPGSTPGRVRDQVAFISGLVGLVSRQYAVDAGRVYASGMSNGGGLASLLALERPDLFAAVGSVAGLYLYPPGPPGDARAVPLIAFHGALDRIVPIAGGVRRLGHPLQPVADWMAAYARSCGCTDRTEEHVVGSVSRVRYTGGRNGSEVVWYRIADAGHTWPGGVPLPEAITGRTSNEVDATRLTWAFFRDHPLAAGGAETLKPAAATPPASPRAS